MPLTTTQINPRALEKALEVIGGEKLKNLVITAYQALDQFETQGFSAGVVDGFHNGYTGGQRDAFAEMVTEAAEEQSLREAARAFDPTLPVPYQGDSGDEDTK